MSRRGRPRREIFACPHCGADVVVGAKVCRECGSDADTGWQDDEEVEYQSLELPSGYSDEPDHPGVGRSERLPLWVVITALVVVTAFAWLTLRLF